MYFKDLLIFLLCVQVSPRVSGLPEEDIRSPRTRIRAGSELPRGCWEPQLGPLEEQNPLSGASGWLWLEPGKLQEASRDTDRAGWADKPAGIQIEQAGRTSRNKALTRHGGHCRRAMAKDLAFVHQILSIPETL